MSQPNWGLGWLIWLHYEAEVQSRSDGSSEAGMSVALLPPTTLLCWCSVGTLDGLLVLCWYSLGGLLVLCWYSPGGLLVVC